MNKIILSSAVFLTSAGSAFSHAGHTEVVNGHSHTIADLALMAATPVAFGLVALAVILFVRNKKS